jgi:hypothetical protein
MYCCAPVILNLHVTALLAWYKSYGVVRIECFAPVPAPLCTATVSSSQEYCPKTRLRQLLFDDWACVRCYKQLTSSVEYLAPRVATAVFGIQASATN